MFEIDGDDIAQLGDEDFRTLIGRLCEHELRLLGYSESHVTWGGNQDASDGGVDVRVALTPGSAITGFIPRPLTVFQSKAEKMPSRKIEREMRPKNLLRPTIEELAEQGGAYVIVSSMDKTSDSALRNRREAMKAAVFDSPHAAGLETDFYDRGRVATWIRRHPTLVPWVRRKIGRPLSGWQGYDAWTTSPLTDKFLTDDTLRIRTPGPALGEGLPIAAGLDALRGELTIPRQVVRLVGLSGVGKTRLVQALFEGDVGEHRLDPSLAVYVDMAASPDPSPSDLATQLIAEGRRIVLIVDNCSQDLHRRLSALCQRVESQISLLTVEYDIREDQPEGTQVFKLDVSSTELIETLLRRRFPFLSQVDSRTAALFSGGNARVGIALAETVKRQGTLAGLTDNELFERLFYQGQAKSESLHVAAQACSLVYSFDGVDVSPTGELAILGGLFGIEPATLYRSVAELNSRGLAQERSKWRAILPQAIANQLATTAMRNVPSSTIQQQFVPNASIRLLRSFSRRIGLLQGNDQAVAVAKQWLGPDGLLHAVAHLDDVGRAMLQNIAPIVPEQTLRAIEQGLARLGKEKAGDLEHYLDLLRSIAYDPLLFERCVALMAAILAARTIDERSHATNTLISLFYCSLSGTHATVEQRVAALETLVSSPDDQVQTLGLLALDAMLEAWSYHSSFPFEFGSQSRDFGFRPKDEKEVNHWFAAVLRYVEPLANSGGSVAAEVRATLAGKFRGIWTRGAVPTELGNVARSISSHAYWPDGWRAVKQTLRFEGKEMIEEYLRPLRSLEIDLRPTDLKQQVRSIVFSNCPMFDFDDQDEEDALDYQAARHRRLSKVRSLGVAVMSEPHVFETMLPEIVASEGELWEFGAGLFEGSDEPVHTWHQLAGAITATDEARQRPEALAGFLHKLNGVDEGLVSAILDEVADSQELARFYPYLQVWRSIGESDVARLKRSLASGKTPVAAYRALISGGVARPIPPSDLREILLAISAKPGGHDAAMELLHMRLFGDQKLEKICSADLMEAGRALLLQMTFDRRSDGGDYHASEVARRCLAGEEGAAVAEELCRKLKLAVAAGKTHALYQDDLLLTLFRLQPIASLEGLCGGDDKQLLKGIALIGDANERKPILSGVREDDLIRWCEVDPKLRYPAIAQVVQYSEGSQNAAEVRWSGTALSLLRTAPDPAAVLRNFVARFRPYSGWVGTFTPTLEARITLLDDLNDFPELKEMATQEKEKLRAAAEEMRQWDFDRDRERYESFE